MRVLTHAGPGLQTGPARPRRRTAALAGRRSGRRMEATDVSVVDATGLVIRPAAEDEVPLVLALIKELARYERMEDQVVATEAEHASGRYSGRRGGPRW